MPKCCELCLYDKYKLVTQKNRDITPCKLENECEKHKLQNSLVKTLQEMKEPVKPKPILIKQSFPSWFNR